MSLLLNFLSDGQYIENGSFRHVNMTDNWNRNVELSKNDYLYLQVEYTDPCTGEYLFTTIIGLACDYKTRSCYTLSDIVDLNDQESVIGFINTSYVKFCRWNNHSGGIKASYTLYYRLMHIRHIGTGRNFDQCLIKTVVEAVIG